MVSGFLLSLDGFGMGGRHYFGIYFFIPVLNFLVQWKTCVIWVFLKIRKKRTICRVRSWPHRPANAIDSGNDSVKRQSSVIQPERGGHDRPLQKELSNNRWIRVSGAPGNVGKERESFRINIPKSVSPTTSAWLVVLTHAINPYRCSPIPFCCISQ